MSSLMKPLWKAYSHKYLKLEQYNSIGNIWELNASMVVIGLNRSHIHKSIQLFGDLDLFGKYSSKHHVLHPLSGVRLVVGTEDT